SSETFRERRAAMLARVEEVRALEEKVRALSARAAPKFRERGQLLPRERLARLLDRGAPCLELSSLAGFGLHDDEGHAQPLGAGNVVGIGFVQGVRCLVSSHDSAIKGGAIAPMGLEKSLRAQELALQNRLPAVSLVESGGAN